jgi:hypothetical protein
VAEIQKQLNASILEIEELLSDKVHFLFFHKLFKLLLKNLKPLIIQVMLYKQKAYEQIPWMWGK